MDHLLVVHERIKFPVEFLLMRKSILSIYSELQSYPPRYESLTSSSASKSLPYLASPLFKGVLKASKRENDGMMILTECISILTWLYTLTWALCAYSTLCTSLHLAPTCEGDLETIGRIVLEVPLTRTIESEWENWHSSVSAVTIKHPGNVKPLVSTSWNCRGM